MNRAASPQTFDDLAWFKSSHSSDTGGNCVEIAYTWRKSTHSGSEGGNCIEIAAHPQAVHIRDSKDPDGPALTVSPAAWTRFVAFAAGADLSV
ncbi:DUF397 domain-containing protein [Streptomyces sp. SPB162]|uniref:DUF397 domain-containing protein n=1 Tax=Streptomyces sp. SPB162 TaxID=2940560 RepID=UPI002405770B|nr:DUF397 domain-containing protein [Streptomyces sp. SPB162]MDF9815859.1 hypothetical protein [Streptomyces sp. SPB162]